jgi:hypothetical protein
LIEIVLFLTYGLWGEMVVKFLEDRLLALVPIFDSLFSHFHDLKKIMLAAKFLFNDLKRGRSPTACGLAQSFSGVCHRIIFQFLKMPPQTLIFSCKLLAIGIMFLSVFQKLLEPVLQPCIAKGGQGALKAGQLFLVEGGVVRNGLC